MFPSLRIYQWVTLFGKIDLMIVSTKVLFVGIPKWGNVLDVIPIFGSIMYSYLRGSNELFPKGGLLGVSCTTLVTLFFLLPLYWASLFIFWTTKLVLDSSNYWPSMFTTYKWGHLATTIVLIKDGIFFSTSSLIRDKSWKVI